MSTSPQTVYRSLAAALALLLPCTALSQADSKRDELTIVEDGASRYAIVVPDDADEARIAKAATLLQKTIAQATGVELPVLKESTLPQGTPAFFLGKSLAARRAGLAVGTVKGWGYLNAASGKDIFLIGEDGEAGIRDRSNIEYLGTLKAVTAFLDAQVGVRFLMPGELGTYVPKLDRLAVDAKMNASWAPRFEYVIGRAPRDRVMGVALNYFGSNAVLFSYGGHSYYGAVPTKTYGKTHPEYFALIGGVRTPKGNHLCISNPDVQELMLKEMESKLDEGYQWVELAQTDGFQPCHCDACVAIHPDKGERTWLVHRKLASEMLKRRPGKKVMMIAYPPTTNPPKAFDSFPENVVIQMCAYTLDAFERWAPFNVEKSVYVYNWGQYLTPGFGPKRTPRYAVEQVRMFIDNRVSGIYICGGLKGGQGSYGLEGPSYYAYGKALGNPDVDPEALLDEYVQAAFEEATVPMRAFFKSMHDRLEAFSIFQRPNRHAAGVPHPFRAPEDFYCHFFPAKLLADMERNLERAGSMATTDRVRAHLRLVEIEFAYVKSLASVFQVYRAYRLSPNQQTLALLGSKVEERSRLIDEWFPGGKPTRIEGLPAPFMGANKAMVEAGGRLRATLGAPLNWNFARLREAGVLPGVGSKKMVVPRVKGIALDGRLNEPAWAEAPRHEMTEISMGAQKNATQFQVAYDENGVIFGFVCETDHIDHFDQIEAVGRDGTAWKQENLEIMIDPFGEREKHVQFILNPVPNSTYDAQYAFIEDPVHPLYGKRDASWHGEWQYVAVIDKDDSRWTAEVRIPFSTLGVNPVSAGTAWTMNVGRTEYPNGYKGGPNYSIWSPNLEARSFHDRSTFGDVTFK